MASNKIHPSYCRFLVIFLVLFCGMVSAQNQITLDVDGFAVQQPLFQDEVIDFLIAFDNSSSTVLIVNVTSSTACGVNITLNSATKTSSSWHLVDIWRIRIYFLGKWTVWSSTQRNVSNIQSHCSCSIQEYRSHQLECADSLCLWPSPSIRIHLNRQRDSW